MEERDFAVITAIILAGIVGGERTSADEKTIKRSIDLAVRLRTLLLERAKGPAPVDSTPV